MTCKLIILNLLHDLFLNLKYSSHWYKTEKNRRSGKPDCTFLSRLSSESKNDIPIKSFTRND